ncbi:MAG: serine/threonine protein kinase [Phycisphaerae bacterium]|jgi:tetratricopeptide (TPR) repeat protein/predicted Ser/Thr protein kinase|nr:serine/threonine protein kinase [Phycisphaerae bacterium]
MITHAREQVGRLSAPPPVGTVPAPPPAWPPTDLIEGYDLLEELHRGGQGVVYRAIQRSTNRIVAIKVLVHGAFATAGERHRFEREVELLARLDAPGIVRIVDSGISSGRWWFAMDHIDGVPLDRVPRERRNVLRLVGKVAEAIHAAHLRGVIHRDLKPRNILVDQRGEPHVLDFGLAYASDTEGLRSITITEPGQFVGSLPWASPEQVVGVPDDLDLRSDIYSLGVLLYQLLTDRFPYRVVGPLHEITEAIARHDPILPSSVDPSIDRDLETIVLTCLRKDPARRYQSAAALASDLASYLRGEPLAARRDALAYVIRLWVARHRIAATLAVGALLLILAGATVTTALWRNAAAAHLRAERESRTSSAVLRFLERTIANADPGTNGGRAMSVVDLMEQARRELDAHGGSDDPLVEAAVRSTVAHVLRQLGRFDEAAELAESALELREEILPAPHVDIGRSLVLLSTIRRHQGERAAALALSERALAMVRNAHDGRDHEDVAEALIELAWSTNRTGESGDAEALLRDAIGMLERLVPAEDERLLTARLNLMLLSHGATSLNECATLVQRLRARFGQHHVASITGGKMLAAMQAFAGQFDLAIGTLREALEATIALYGRTHPLAIDTLLSLASLEGQSGAHAGDPVRGARVAYDLLLAAQEEARTAYGDTHIGWAQFQHQLGGFAATAGTGDEETWLRGAVTTFEASGAPAGGDQAAATLELAVVCYRHGATFDAARFARAALDISLPPAHRWVPAQASALLGRIELDRGHLADAERHLLAANQALRLDPARNARAIPGTTRDLARLYEAWQEREPTEARAAALARWRKEVDLLPPPPMPAAPSGPIGQGPSGSPPATASSLPGPSSSSSGTP